MFIHNESNDVQCNILTLLNSGTRVCVFLKNYTNVKFSLSNARTAKKKTVKQKLHKNGVFCISMQIMREKRKNAIYVVNRQKRDYARDYAIAFF